MDYNGDDIYERCDNYYTNASSVPTSSETIPKPLPSLPKKSLKKNWSCIAGVFETVILVLLVAILAETIVIKNSQQTKYHSPTSTANANDSDIISQARSCMDLREKGVNTNGIKNIRLNDSSVPIEVYCDMETNGGGWTLVASVHERDINEKCFSDDLWSGYVPAGQTSHAMHPNEINHGYRMPGKTNWETDLVFGSARHCCQEDYKSTAYHQLNASDLMVWHVPRGIDVDTMRRNAIFRYRTTSKFLQQHGGNLKALFSDHFPLSVDRDSNATTAVLNAISNKFVEITRAIPNFYTYVVNESLYYVKDSNMYDRKSGNRIEFQRNGWSRYLKYGEQYRDIKSHTTVISSSTAPFTLISDIRNEDRLTNYFLITVASYRTTEAIWISEFENIVKLGNFKLHYHAYQIYDSRKLLKTVCRLHFYISNVKEWRSIEPTAFFKNREYISHEHIYTNFYIDGRPSRILFGYMLLSRDEGMNITSAYLDRVATLILQSISGLSNVMRAPSADKTLVVPITFDKGTAGKFVEGIPPHMKSNISPGYIQFRAYNLSGYPNAFCPGIRVDSISPEYVCVGGVSGDRTPYGTCGDFAGWRGKSTDSLSVEHPIGHSHSSNDILSTLLFFYR